MTGMGLLAAGLLILVGTTGPYSSAWSLMPGLIVIGIASGATFAPLQQATMDGVDAQQAGAASGVSSTTRQLGGVLGTAVIGALLSVLLTTSLHDEAERMAGHLPEHLRGHFVENMTGGAQRLAPPQAPGGLDASTSTLYRQLTSDGFATGFTGAMHTTLLAAAATLVLAALGCLFFRTSKKTKPVQGDEKSAQTASRS